MLDFNEFGASWITREDHEQALAEKDREIARLREAVENIVKIRFLLGNDPKLNPAYEMGDIAQQALKESTGNEPSSHGG